MPCNKELDSVIIIQVKTELTTYRFVNETFQDDSKRGIKKDIVAAMLRRHLILTNEAQDKSVVNVYIRTLNPEWFHGNTKN